MNLRQTTHDIIRLVEERSGFPVQVLEDPNLPVIALARSELYQSRREV